MSVVDAEREYRLPDVMPARRTAPDECEIAALVQQTAASYEVVRQLYCEEFAALKAEAKVEAFLGIIASRRVRQRLRAVAKTAHPVQRNTSRPARAHITAARPENSPGSGLRQARSPVLGRSMMPGLGAGTALVTSAD